jgi:hypothetical protein
VEVVKMGCKLKNLSNWKIQSVENGEDELQIKINQTGKFKVWKMMKMGCKLKIYQTGKFKVWKMVKMGCKLKIYQTGKFKVWKMVKMGCKFF